MIPLFWAGLAASCYMTGVVWFAQLVHYPLLDRTPAESFPAFARAYQRRTFAIVAAPMLVEAVAAAALPWMPLPEGTRPLAWAALALAALIWVSTACLQAPQHLALARGFDAGRHRRLVRWNWARTAAWSARSALLLWIAARLG